ncbi:hypothetical protein BDW22DRAFT_1429258 [Trametopsis cervina]|nr:hypothetical protein BDW22DRAFT_1429258 [Trametopsis cervina]
MSIYARYQLPGLLSQHPSHLWYTAPTTHTSQSFSPSPSVSSVKTCTVHLNNEKHRPVVRMMAKGYSSSQHGDHQTVEYDVLPTTPSKNGAMSPAMDDVGSPVPSWVDEETLTNTPGPVSPKASKFPCTPPSVSPKAVQANTLRSLPPLLDLGHHHHRVADTSVDSLLFWTPKHAARLRNLSNSTSHPTERLPSVIADRRSSLEGIAVPMNLDDDVSMLGVATPPRTPEQRQQPKLRRSTGNDNLRTLYHRGGLPEHHAKQAPVSFEEELTLAILAEMARSTHFPTARGVPQDPARHHHSAKALLSTLGDFLRTVRFPASRMF